MHSFTHVCVHRSGTPNTYAEVTEVSTPEATNQQHMLQRLKSNSSLPRPTSTTIVSGNTSSSVTLNTSDNFPGIVPPPPQSNLFTTTHKNLAFEPDINQHNNIGDIQPPSNYK